MGAYADKLSYEERWDVIHYIRSLQAKSLKVKYDAESNQLNADFGVPQAMVKKIEVKNDMPANETGNQDTDVNHQHGSDVDHEGHDQTTDTNNGH